MSNSNKDQRMNSGERSSLLQFLNPQTSTHASSEFIGTLPSIFSTNIGPTSHIGSLLNQNRTSFQESFQTPQEEKKQQNFVRLPPLASAIPHVPTPVLAQLASPFYPINPQVYWNNESNSPPQLQKREVESVDVRAPAKRQKTIVQSTEVQEKVARVPTNRKYFKILAEPYDQQRKSYANENRHILPKPLIICPIQEGTTKSEGTVSVRLVTENMKELDDTKGSILQGNTIQTLDPFQRAQFILKIMDTSEGGKFRLIFTITYQINGQPTLYEDVVVSQPFKVTSNKKIVPEAPKVVGMKPEEINCKRVSEAWIKGKCFNENKNLRIQFGDTLAEIVEVEDNLITCMIPHMPNLTESKTVFVVVYATGPDGVEIPVSPQLAFTYIVDSSRR